MATTAETKDQALFKFVDITKCKETERLEDAIYDFYEDFEKLPENRIEKLIEKTEKQLINVMEREK